MFTCYLLIISLTSHMLNPCTSVIALLKKGGKLELHIEGGSGKRQRPGD